MNEKILNHYLEFGMFANPGMYAKYFRSLPDNIRELGLLVRKQLVHRSTLEAGNVGSNADLTYGDMTNVPWYRQAEDDYLVTVPAIVAELFRRNEKGLFLPKKLKISILVSS